MRRFLALAFILALIIGIGPPPPSEPTPYGPNTLQLVNGYRRDKGLKTLLPDKQLVESAKAKCLHMQTNRYWAHDAPDRTWQSFMPKNRIIGENLARGYYSDSDIVAAWQASPLHDANLKHPAYSKIGMAACDGAMGRLVVQHFSS